jgi:predicted SprT family Zn-dependent metalloprotease
MVTRHPSEPTIRRFLARLGEIWRFPQVGELPVVFSSRLRTSLGRCRPASGRITLSARLLSDLRHVLEEALCHEAAHFVARARHGSGIKPHGVEWQDLVRQAGFRPRRVIGAVLGDQRQELHVESKRYAHRCPVCQSVRFAKRPVGSWRCFDCRENGLPGLLVVALVSPGEK